MGRLAVIRRLDALAAGPDAADRSGGVLMMPPIEYDLDAWQAKAMGKQEALAHATRAGIDDDPKVSINTGEVP